MRGLRGGRGAKRIAAIERAEGRSWGEAHPPVRFLAAPSRRRPPHEVPRSSRGQYLLQPQTQMEPERIAEGGEVSVTQPIRSNRHCAAMDMTCSSCAIESNERPLVAADNNT